MRNAGYSIICRKVAQRRHENYDSKWMNCVLDFKFCESNDFC